MHVFIGSCVQSMSGSFEQVCRSLLHCKPLACGTNRPELTKLEPAAEGLANLSRIWRVEASSEHKEDRHFSVRPQRKAWHRNPQPFKAATQSLTGMKDMAVTVHSWSRSAAAFGRGRPNRISVSATIF